MNKWLQVTIDEVASVKSGKRLPKGHSLVSENTDLPYVRLVDVSDGVIRKDNLLFLKPETHKSIEKYIVNEGDVCLAIVGHTIGMVFQVDQFFHQANLTENAARITDFDDNVISKYLYYYLTSKVGQQEIISRKVGSAQGKLPMYNIRSLPINLPPLPEQKAIAHILGTLDDKIELNRKMNQTLEAMAQALFKSWFVDFDPVIDNALAAGHEIPEALQAKAEKRKAILDRHSALDAESSTAENGAPLLYANPELAKLFPSSFTYNETLEKWVPEGWEVKKLGDATIELRRGISPKYIEEGGVRVLNQKCVRNHEVDYSLARRNDPSKKKVDGRLLQPKDMVVNSTGTGTLGRVANILSLDEDTVVDSHVTVLRANENIILKNFFNGLIFSLEKFIEEMGEGSTGQTELSRARLSEVEILVPDMRIQAIADNVLDRNYAKKDKNNQESQTLTQLRDTLLPQLISGKVRVPEDMIDKLEHKHEVVK